MRKVTNSEVECNFGRAVSERLLGTQTDLVINSCKLLKHPLFSASSYIGWLHDFCCIVCFMVHKFHNIPILDTNHLNHKSQLTDPPAFR